MESIDWRSGGVRLIIDAPDDDFPAVRWIGPPESAPPERGPWAVPLVELRAGGAGGSLASSERVMGGRLSRRMRFVWYDVSQGGRSLAVTLRDPVTGLRTVSTFEAFDDVCGIRTWTRVIADDGPAELHVVSSVSLGGLSSVGGAWWTDRLGTAQNSWCREVSWQERVLADEGVDDVGTRRWGYATTKACVVRSTSGTWSSGGRLPLGMLSAHDRPRVLVWQLEPGGAPWRWEVGDYGDSTYLVAGGPTGPSHGWAHPLDTGDSFTTMPVTLTVGRDLDETIGAMTRIRRRVRRPHLDHRRLPVVFNDFMNGSMGDPTESSLLPMIAAAQTVGAEVFCIDAGWYAQDGEWWDAVGEWQPAAWRFPNGIESVLDAIRDAGMVPGLWLEPEVVGVRSPIAESLPADAFFQRGGERVVEAARFQLDFRHPDVRRSLDGVVDRLVGDYGIGYLKLDYNIDVTAGTDVDAPGGAVDGLVGHTTAYLRWLDSVLVRHPGLTVENCASGGQRIDNGLLSRLQLQSMSDNQDPLATAAIAASAPSAVTAEQAAIWSYPDPAWSPELVAFTLVNSLLGRVHLSGRIDLLDDARLAQVRESVEVYRAIRGQLRDALPFWPLGLPGWHDDWLALGMRGPDDVLLAVWRRGGPTSCAIPVGQDEAAHAEVLFPALPTGLRRAEGSITVELPAEPSARLLRLQNS